MLTPKSYTFALVPDDGTLKVGALGHGMVARKGALVLSFGRGLTRQMMRSRLSFPDTISEGFAGSYETKIV